MSEMTLNYWRGHDARRNDTTGCRWFGALGVLAGHALVVLALCSFGRVVLAPLAPEITVMLLSEPTVPPPPPRPVSKPILAASRMTPELILPTVALPVASADAAPQAGERIANAVPPAPTFSGHGDAPAGPTPPRFDADYLRNPAPAYPPLSRRAREEGTVLLRVQVAADGHALDVVVERSSGFERLDHAARVAVRLWIFVPAKQGDTTLAASVLVPIRFSLAH